MGDQLTQCGVCKGFVANDDTWVVACDTCNLWIHYKCTGLTKELFYDIENRPWICRICEEDPNWDLKPLDQDKWMDSEYDASQTSGGPSMTGSPDQTTPPLPAPGHLIWAKLGGFVWQPAIIRDNAAGCSDSFWVKWLDPKSTEHFNSEVLKKEMTQDFGLHFRQRFQMQKFKKKKDYRSSIVLAIRLYWRAIGRPLKRGMSHWNLLSIKPTDPQIFITEQCYIEELFDIEHKPIQKKGHQVIQQIQFNCYVCHCGKPFEEEKDWHKHLEDPDMERCGWCITKVQSGTVDPRAGGEPDHGDWEQPGSEATTSSEDHRDQKAQSDQSIGPVAAQAQLPIPESPKSHSKPRVVGAIHRPELPQSLLSTSAHSLPE